jgi:hypothetical protein
LSVKCPTCRDTKHILTAAGAAKRCPDCFTTDNVSRILRMKGYPEEWAVLTLDRLASVVGDAHPVVGGLRSFLTGYGQCIHLYGPPSPARQATFAVLLRGLLAKHRRANIFDSAELAVEYFKKHDRQEFRIEHGPIVFTLGKEMEKKVGAFFLRTCVEYAVARRIPMALLTDYNPESMTSQYFEFRDMLTLGSFKSFNVTG